AGLAAAVDQLDRLTAHNVPEELRQHARAALLRIIHAVQARADPVEGAEQRELQPLLAVPPDDPVEQLLDAGIDPALLVNGAEHELGGFRIEFFVAAGAVDLRGRGEYHALLVLDAVADDGQVRLEVQFEHPQRLAHIGGRGRNGDQRQDDIALAHMVFDPLLVDGDVALEEVEARIVKLRADALRLQVHPVDVPVGGPEDVLAQVMADEAVDAENEHIFQVDPPIKSMRAADSTAPPARTAAPAAVRRSRA